MNRPRPTSSAPEEGLLHPVREIMHALLVAAELIVVEVVDDDVVRAALAVAQASWRLSPSACEELHAVRSLELSVLPRCAPALPSEVGDDALVVFQLRLYVPEQAYGGVL